MNRLMYKLSRVLLFLKILLSHFSRCHAAKWLSSTLYHLDIRTVEQMPAEPSHRSWPKQIQMQQERVSDKKKREGLCTT